MSTTPSAIRSVMREHHRDPLSTCDSNPRLFWVTDTTSARWSQEVREIDVTGTEGTTSTGRVASRDQMLVA